MTINVGDDVYCKGSFAYGIAMKVNYLMVEVKVLVGIHGEPMNGMIHHCPLELLRKLDIKK